MNNSKTVNPNLKLLQSINEASFLDRVKNALNGSKEDDKAQMQQEPEKISSIQSASALDSIVGKALSSGSAIRTVAFLNTGELSNGYLRGGGGHAILDSIPDAELQKFAEDPYGDDSRIKFLKSNFSFADQVKDTGISKGAMAVVLMDIPSQLKTQLENADSVEKIKVVLKEILNHKYYAMTLSLKAALQIADKMDSGDHENAIEAFNPDKVLKNYPIKQVRVLAQNEWNKQFGEGRDQSEVDSIMRKAERAEKRREGERRLAGDPGEQEQIILSRITSANSDDEAANVISGMINDLFTVDQAVTVLKKLNTGLKSSRIDSLINKLTA